MIDILNRDDWSAQEIAAGEAFSVTCRSTIEHIVLGLSTIETDLPDNKRALVEMVTLIEAAARLASMKLDINEDDFAVSACEVFQHTKG